jgi:hypothetical protein
MSANNGDKARFHRNRKRKAAKRLLLTALRLAAAKLPARQAA